MKNEIIEHKYLTLFALIAELYSRIFGIHIEDDVDSIKKHLPELKDNERISESTYSNIEELIKRYPTTDDVVLGYLDMAIADIGLEYSEIIEEERQSLEDCFDED